VLHFDCRLNWKEQIARKRKQIDLKTKEVNWLMGKNIPSIYRIHITHLQSGNETYKELRNRPVGLRQTIQRSYHAEIQIQKSVIANAPWYVTNHTLHTHFNILYVSDVIHERINKHRKKLAAHPTPLLEPLIQAVNIRRLKKMLAF